MFADIAMPGGVSGVELAREVRRLRPEVRVLLTSGYAQSGLELGEDPPPLLAKPYQHDELTRRILETLETAAA